MSNLPEPIENAAARSKWIKQQNDIYDDYVKGNQNFTALAKRHGVTRAEAIKMVEEVNEYIRASSVFKEMAKERLAEMDHHYSMLIKKVWDSIEELESEGKYDRVPPATKIAGDLEAKRQDALQKAGMYEDYEVGDMLAEAERKVDAIKDLLKLIISKYPETKNDILNGLKDIQDPNRLPEPDVIDGEVA